MSAIIWVLSRKPNGSFIVKSLRSNLGVWFGPGAPWNYLESTISAKVDLNIDPIPVFAHKLVGMTRVTVHVVVTVRGTTVGEQNQKLVNTLRVLRKIVLTKREISVRRWNTGDFKLAARPDRNNCQLTQNMSASFRCV